MAGRMLGLLAFVAVSIALIYGKNFRSFAPAKMPALIFEPPRVVVLPKPAARAPAKVTKAVKPAASAAEKAEEEEIPSAPYSYEDLRQFADQDGVCSVMKMGDIPGQDIAKLFAEIGGASSAKDRELDSLLREDGPFNGTSLSGENSIMVDFFNALLLSEQLDGASAGRPDLERALKIFESLSRRDPDNGAHPFFAAGAAMLAGRRDSEVKRLLTEASKRKRFETYVSEIARGVEERALKNSTYYYLAFQYIDRMPSLNYGPIHRQIQDYIAEGDVEFTRSMMDVCFLMAAGAATQTRGNEGSFAPYARDFATGSRCYLKARESLDPEGPKPALMTYAELLRRTSEKTDAALAKMDPAWRTRFTTCERREFDEYFSDVRKQRQVSLRDIIGNSRIPR
ncbi:MAG: hypothetical protein ABL958_01685 [Bdellovibrionia bacterium]